MIKNIDKILIMNYYYIKRYINMGGNKLKKFLEKRTNVKYLKFNLLLLASLQLIVGLVSNVSLKATSISALVLIVILLGMEHMATKDL